MRSALYSGRVHHRRLGRIRHRFAYRVFSLLIDLDELPLLGLRLLRHNRPGLMSFHDADHGPTDGSALRPWVEAQLRRAGYQPDGWRIALLCYPRLLGYAFNPLSVYFCHDPAGCLRAVLYDVRNTFGDKHGYLIPVAQDRAPGAPIVQACAKQLHVSPFFDLEGGYRFRLDEPGERLSLYIAHHAQGEDRMIAVQTGRRSPLTDAALLRAFIQFPLMTVKVITAIHWQALRLWLKGARFHRRPAPPAQAVAIVGREER